MIEDEGRIRMSLEEAGRDGVGHVPFNGPLHDPGLVLAKRHDDDPAGLQNRAHAHGHGLLRHIFLAEEIARGIAARHGIKRRQARTAVPGRARLVEANVSCPADAEHLQVDAAGAANLLLVVRAIAFGVFCSDGPVGNMDVFGLDVYLVEKGLAHPAVIAVRIVRRQTEVLIEVEGNHPREIETVLPVHSDQLAVHSNWSRAGGESQDRRLAGRVFLPNETFDHAGHVPRRLRACGEN